MLDDVPMNTLVMLFRTYESTHDAVQLKHLTSCVATCFVAILTPPRTILWLEQMGHVRPPDEI